MFYGSLSLVREWSQLLKNSMFPYLLWFSYGLEVSSTYTSSSRMLTFEEGKKKKEEIKEVVFKSIVKIQLVI